MFSMVRLLSRTGLHWPSSAGHLLMRRMNEGAVCGLKGRGFYIASLLITFIGFDNLLLPESLGAPGATQAGRVGLGSQSHHSPHHKRNTQDMDRPSLDGKT